MNNELLALHDELFNMYNNLQFNQKQYYLIIQTLEEYDIKINLLKNKLDLLSQAECDISTSFFQHNVLATIAWLISIGTFRLVYSIIGSNNTPNLTRATIISLLLAFLLFSKNYLCTTKEQRKILQDNNFQKIADTYMNTFADKFETIDLVIELEERIAMLEGSYEEVIDNMCNYFEIENITEELNIRK